MHCYHQPMKLTEPGRPLRAPGPPRSSEIATADEGSRSAFHGPQSGQVRRGSLIFPYLFYFFSWVLIEFKISAFRRRTDGAWSQWKGAGDIRGLKYGRALILASSLLTHGSARSGPEAPGSGWSGWRSLWQPPGAIVSHVIEFLASVLVVFTHRQCPLS